MTSKNLPRKPATSTGQHHVATPEDAVMAPIRQQLSCASKELLEKAAHREIAALNRLRDELFGLQAGRDAIDKVDQRIREVELAIRQLSYVYVDQFELGRAENDQAGRFGLIRGG